MEEDFTRYVIRCGMAEADDGAGSDGVTHLTDDIWVVTMELNVEAPSADEALERAMRWRDVVAVSEDSPQAALDFGWHLHHPWGC